MVREVLIKNLETENEILLCADHGAYIIESIDWGSPEIVLGSYRVPKQIGNFEKGVVVGNREIVITGYVRAEKKDLNKLGKTWKEYYADQEKQIEESKLFLDQIFSVYQTLKIETNGYFINGKAEFPVKYSFVNGENNEVLCLFTVSVLCFDPMFKKGITAIAMMPLKKMFHFPLIIPEESGVVFGELADWVSKKMENNGDVPVGCVIRMEAYGGTVRNPKLINVSRNEYIGFANVVLAENDYILINTKKGEESVVKYSSGYPSSLIGNLLEGSTFLQIYQGGDYFHYDMDGSETNLHTTVEYSETFFNFRGM